MTKPYFKLFACCIPVKGAVNHVLCDLQRNYVQPIPESLYVILTELNDLKLEEIKEIFEHQQDAQIDEYFSFLESGEWGFWCDDPSLFPELDLTWDSPLLVTNAIIDLDDQSKHPYSSIFRQLNQLGCEALQIRSYGDLDIKTLTNILNQIGDSRLRSVELIIKYLTDYSETVLTELCRQFPMISSITLHSASEEYQLRTASEVTIHFTPQIIDSSAHCGIINAEYFVSNLSTFTEAQQHNSCLNRKIAIDIHGHIKNCPSMLNSFGHIDDTSLRTVISQEEFRSMWHISKDQVAVCSDCEFRYICTDCRAFTQNGDLYSKPEKCNYDPYKGKWLEKNMSHPELC